MEQKLEELKAENNLDLIHSFQKSLHQFSQRYLYGLDFHFHLEDGETCKCCVCGKLEHLIVDKNASQNWKDLQEMATLFHYYYIASRT